MYLDLLLKNGYKFVISQVVLKIDTNQMLRSDLCDFSDAYIVVNDTITLKKNKLKFYWHKK